MSRITGMSRSTSRMTDTTTRSRPWRAHGGLARRTAVVAAVAAIGTGALGLAGAQASAADRFNARTLQALCQAGGGEFRTGRFGEVRCYGPDLDGMGVFWAERSVCERSAGRPFGESVVDAAAGTGAWICAPTSI